MIALGTRVPVAPEALVAFAVIATVFAMLFVRGGDDGQDDLDEDRT